MTNNFLLLLEDGQSKIMFEGFYDSIVQEDDSNLELEEQQSEDNYVLFEPITDTVQIRTEDGIDEIILEDNDLFGQLVLEDSLGGGKVLCETTTIGLETDQTGNTFILISEPDTDTSSYVVLELDEVTYDQRITVTDRDDSPVSSYLRFNFQKRKWVVHIDMGYGSQLRLETDIPQTFLEYQLQMDLLTF